MEKRLAKTLLLFLVFIILTLNYSSDFMGLVDFNWFASWQSDSDSLIWKRIDEVEKYGFLYHSGMLGSNYNSSVGLQGNIFSLINSFFSNNLSKQVFYFINSGVLVVFLILLLLWIKSEFGNLASIAVFLSCLFNPWLTVSAKSVYWVIFTFFAPFICSLYFLKIDEKRNIDSKKLYIISCILIFLRCCCGFEFVSTIMIGLEAPVFYYALKNQWNKRRFFRVFVGLLISALCGFALALSVHLLQLSAALGGFREAIDAQIGNIGYRTGFMHSGEMDELIESSLEASRIDIVFTYFFNSEVLLGLPMIFWIVFFLLSFCLSFISPEFSNRINCNRNKILALNLMNFVLFLGPLSWFILASGHSYIHTHINYILFSTPLLLFLVCQITFVFVSLFIDLFRVFKNQMIATAGLTIILLMCVYMEYCRQGSSIKTAIRNGNIAEIFNDENFGSIYYDDNKLLYMTNEKYDNTVFLHVFQQGNTEYVNCDFPISNNIIPTYFWSGDILSQVNIPVNEKIDSIQTGIWDGETNLYQTDYIDLNSYIKTPNSIKVFELTDERWDNGYKIDENCLLLYPVEYEYHLLEGQFLLMPDGSENLITDVRVEGDYMHLYFENPVIDHSISEYQISD